MASAAFDPEGSAHRLKSKPLTKRSPPASRTAKMVEYLVAPIRLELMEDA